MSTKTNTKTRLSEVRGSVGFTINLGNYESMRVEVGETRVVNDGTTDEEAYADLRDSLELQINKLVQESKEIKNMKEDI